MDITSSRKARGHGMAEDEQLHLNRCLERGVCPTCGEPTKTKYGSGQSKDGVFCSLGCYGKWHKGALVRRHQDRMKNEAPDE